MASPKLSGLSVQLLLLLAVVVMTEPGIAFQLEADDTISHFPPLLDCGPEPKAALSSAFGANVLSLLDALPPAAAAAPTGFVAARSRGAAGSGDGSSSPATASDCLACLCAADRAAAECARCLDESARVVPELKRKHRLSQIHGDAVVVVGYSCYLRVLLEAPLPRWRVYAGVVLAIVEIVVIALVEVWAILFCIRRAGQMNPNPA